MGDADMPFNINIMKDVLRLPLQFHTHYYLFTQITCRHYFVGHLLITDAKISDDALQAVLP